MEPFHPIRARAVSGDVLHQILERIRAGQIAEGDLLPSERLLAAQMDVSRPTVRAALERLTTTGVVSVTAGRGGGAQVVSTWIPDDLDDPVFVQPDVDAMFGLLEARRTLEPRVAQLAALRGNADHFDAMEQSILLLRQQKGDLRRTAQAESRFHRIMWRAAGNPSLERMMIDLSRDLDVVHDLMHHSAEDYGAAADLHESTLLALREGDPALVETEMIRHIGHFELIVEDVLRQRAHRSVPEFLQRVAE